MPFSLMIAEVVSVVFLNKIFNLANKSEILCALVSIPSNATQIVSACDKTTSAVLFLIEASLAFSSASLQ